MLPTPSFQKNLIIVLSGSTIRGDIESKAACWFVPRDDAWAWLEERRPFFPQASSQELVALAVLPEDLRGALAATMCNLKVGSGFVDLAACQEPQFSGFTSTSAICLTRVVSLGDAKDLMPRFRQATAFIAKQIALSIPSATRFPNGFISKHATHADAEASMLARIDQIALRGHDASPALLAPALLAPNASAPKPRL